MRPRTVFHRTYKSDEVGRTQYVEDRLKIVFESPKFAFPPSCSGQVELNTVLPHGVWARGLWKVLKMEREEQIVPR